jgi:hypothetical protein
MNHLPLCAVKGLIRHGAICSKVIVGMRHCGYGGVCQHKVPTVPATASAQQGEQA